MSEDEESASQKGRLWKIDPDLYRSRSKPQGIRSSFAGRLKSLGFLGFVSLIMFYPIFLIYMGLVYGWIGFWGSFIGSVVLIGLGIRQAGYSRNFENFGTGSFIRQIIMLVVAFGAAAAFFEGLFVARVWLLPGMLSILLLVLAYRLLRK